MTRCGQFAGMLLLLCCAVGCRNFGPPNEDKFDQLLMGDNPRRDLLIGIRHPDANLRRWSILNLARHGEPAPVERIVFSLEEAREPSPLVRSAAATALRMLGDKRAIPALMEATGDINPLVRADVVSALGTLGGQEQVERLIVILRTDPNVEVRLQAVRALARIGGNDALKRLIVHMADFDESVAFACHRALVNMTGEDLPPRIYLWEERLLKSEAPEG